MDLYGGGPPAELALIYISRIKTGGRPYFRSLTLGFVLPLQVEEIERKLQKRYDTQAPLELLAYIENGEVRHQSDVDKITEIAARLLPASQFRRVWVFEGLFRQIGLCFNR